MKKSTLFTFGFVLLLIASLSSYLYLYSQSVTADSGQNTLELVQTSANQFNQAGEVLHKSMSFLQRLLAH